MDELSNRKTSTPGMLRYLPLGGLAAALLILMDAVRLLLPIMPNTGLNTVFLVSTASAIIVCSAVSTVWGAISAETIDYRYRSLRFGGLLSGVGMVTAWLVSITALPSIIAVLSGLACGTGIAAISVAWCLSLARLAERQVLLALAMSCVVAGIIKAILCLLSMVLTSFTFGVIMIATILVAFIASSAVPVTNQAEAASAPPAPSSDVEKQASTEFRGESLAERVKGMFGRNWVIFCGLLLCVTIAAGIWSDPLLVARGGGRGPNTADSVIGFLVGALFLLLAARLVKDEIIRVLYLALPLASVAILIIVWLLHSWTNDEGGVVSFAPLGFSTAVCVCLHVSRLVTETDRGLSPLLVFGVFMTIAAGVFLAWFGIWSMLGPSGASAVDLTFKVVYLMAVAVQLVVLTQRQPVLASKAADMALSEVCGEIVGRFALSEREAAILRYLVQGRSYAYIAEQQFVSINTVKTHAKRIYAKTGMHSKQDLLDFAYSNNFVMRR
ncbi:MAG: helix-turn-helix transcriptional regulator [Coriobacteriales bacterium]|jgi:DNA-binding CsgD family transcriptional regulator|nr:helix-turn-helix transcriptional regulator [Coriobacteriales bacterium]